MALINCPECKKEVSDKTFNCPNCGFTLITPKRGIIGIIFKSIFIIYNIIMMLVILFFIIGSNNVPETTTMSVFGDGILILIFIWIMLGLPLALMNYLTRPKAYD